MQMLYNSDSFAVVQFDVPDRPAGGGFEIVDKHARKEVFLQGALADTFRTGVQALMDDGPTEEAVDDYLAGFTLLAHQPVLLH